MQNIWKQSISFDFLAIDVSLLILNSLFLFLFFSLWFATNKIKYITKSRKKFIVWFSVIFLLENMVYCCFNVLNQTITCYIFSSLFYPLNCIKEWMLGCYLIEMYFLYVRKHQLKKQKEIEVFKQSTVHQIYKFIVQKISFATAYMISLIAIFLGALLFEFIVWKLTDNQCTDESIIVWIQILTRIATNSMLLCFAMVFVLFLIVQFLRNFKKESFSIESTLKIILIDNDPHLFKTEVIVSYTFYFISLIIFMTMELFISPILIERVNSRYFNLIIYTMVSIFHQLMSILCFLSFPVMVDLFLFTKSFIFHRILKKKQNQLDQVKKIIASDSNSKNFKLFESYCVSTWTQENIHYVQKFNLFNSCKNYITKKKFASTIIDEFIKIKSNKELNISSYNRKQCLKRNHKVQNSSKHQPRILDNLFDDVNCEVFETLLSLYYQFEQTSAFKKMEKPIISKSIL